MSSQTGDQRTDQPVPRVVKGMEAVELSQKEFRARFLKRFYDPAFERASMHIEALLPIAWEAYKENRKNPRTTRAGHGFADPDYDLSIEWLETRQRIKDGPARHRACRPCAGPADSMMRRGPETSIGNKEQFILRQRITEAQKQRHMLIN